MAGIASSQGYCVRVSTLFQGTTAGIRFFKNCVVISELFFVLCCGIRLMIIYSPVNEQVDRYLIVMFVLFYNYRLNDGNEYLFQAKDDVSTPPTLLTISKGRPLGLFYKMFSRRCDCPPAIGWLCTKWNSINGLSCRIRFPWHPSIEKYKSWGKIVSQTVPTSSQVQTLSRYFFKADSTSCQGTVATTGDSSILPSGLRMKINLWACGWLKVEL